MAWRGERLRPAIRWRLVEALVAEARRDLTDAGYDRRRCADAVLDQDGEIVGCVISAYNAAGDEASERVLYPREQDGEAGGRSGS